MLSLSFGVFEVAVLALMALCLWQSWFRAKDLFLGLLVGVEFTLFGEYVATYVTKEYYYRDFFIKLVCVAENAGGYGPRPLTCDPAMSCIPLVIPVMESIIIYAALCTVRQLRLPPVAAGLYCGLLALCVDLAMDPIVSQSIKCFGVTAEDAQSINGRAIGLGFWVWMLHDPKLATLGVINNNYAGWFLGTASLAIALQWANREFNLSQHGWKRNLVVVLLAVPCIALPLFLGSFRVYYLVSQKLHVPYLISLFVIAAVSILVVLSKWKSMHLRTPLDGIALAVPAFFYMFTFAAMLIFQMYTEPGLVTRWTCAFLAGAGLFLLPSLQTLVSSREVVPQPTSSVQ